MILAGALLNALEERIVFAHERLDQAAIIVGQARDDGGEFRRAVEADDGGGLFLESLAYFARALDGQTLLLDGADRLENLVGVAPQHSLLLFFKASEHFAVLLKLLAE